MAWTNPQGIRAESKGPDIIIGRVKDIVLGPYKSGDTNLKDDNFSTYDDIGKISFEFMYSPNSISLGSSSKEAYPIFSVIKQLPVIGEIVFITRGPFHGLNDNFNSQRLFYFPPFQVWNSVNHNAFPNMEEWAQFTQQYKKQANYQGQSQSSDAEWPKGYSFSEKDIKSLTPFEGDTIIESRFGQSIRFGSTTPVMKKFNHWSSSGNNGDPITIIRNGQGKVSNSLDPFATTVEDINSDASSVYLTAGQAIIIDSIQRGDYPLNSFESVDVQVQQQNVIASFYQLPVSNNSQDAASQDSSVLNSLSTPQ
jgi:hypothetical protein